MRLKKQKRKFYTGKPCQFYTEIATVKTVIEHPKGFFWYNLEFADGVTLLLSERELINAQNSDEGKNSNA